MELLDLYYGRKAWSDCLQEQLKVEGLEEFFSWRPGGPDSPVCGAEGARVALELSPADYETVLESGLGAMGAAISKIGFHARMVTTTLALQQYRAGGEGGYPADRQYGVGRERGDPSEPGHLQALIDPTICTLCTLELGMDVLAGGIDRLNADFNLFMGDIIWKLEMQHETLSTVLQEIRLAEFEREARAYRTRAERAYINGWYEEALGDFLEAEARNYPDFAVHRSIANISLYHLVDLPRALDYFRKAAKYARPSDRRQSAEAHLFAGIVCIMLRQLEDAISHMAVAANLNPELYEAHYQNACLQALCGQADSAMANLEPAINGDPRYYERARRDSLFDEMRPQVEGLLDRLLEPVHHRMAQVERDKDKLSGYVIAAPEKEHIAKLFRAVEEKRDTAATTYKAGLVFLETLSELQRELAGIHDLFYKQYEMDPRDYVRSIAFSPDGRLLASGFLNGGIRIWSVYDGRDAVSFQGHLASVNSVAFSPDGEMLASAGRDRAIKIWDVASGDEMLSLAGHDDEVSAVAFSPDGQWLASGSYDKTVRIWRAATGHEVQPLFGHTKKVTSALFSPDGKWLASGSSDKTVKLWDVLSGLPILTLMGNTRGVASLAFSPDGKLLASGGEDTRVRLWDTTSGDLIRTLSGLRYGATSVACSPDGETVAAGSLGQTVSMWKLATGAPIKNLRFDDISYNSVAFSPQGYWLALGSRDLQLWLKVVLTPEEYTRVKAGEARARVKLQARY
jgi:tetratricopeptide (TPR) repeat protein